MIIVRVLAVIFGTILLLPSICFFGVGVVALGSKLIEAIFYLIIPSLCVGWLGWALLNFGLGSSRKPKQTQGENRNTANKNEF